MGLGEPCRMQCSDVCNTQWTNYKWTRVSRSLLSHSQSSDSICFKRAQPSSALGLPWEYP